MWIILKISTSLVQSSHLAPFTFLLIQFRIFSCEINTTTGKICNGLCADKASARQLPLCDLALTSSRLLLLIFSQIMSELGQQITVLILSEFEKFKKQSNSGRDPIEILDSDEDTVSTEPPSPQFEPLSPPSLQADSDSQPGEEEEEIE